MEFLRLYAAAPAKPAPAKPAPEKPAPVPETKKPKGSESPANKIFKDKLTKFIPNLTYFEKSLNLGKITTSAKNLWKANYAASTKDTIKLVNKFMKDNGYNMENGYDDVSMDKEDEPIPFKNIDDNLPAIELMYRGDDENTLLGETGWDKYYQKTQNLSKDLWEGEVPKNGYRNHAQYFWLLLLLWATYRDEAEEIFPEATPDKLDAAKKAEEKKAEEKKAEDTRKAEEKAKIQNEAKKNQKKYPNPGTWDVENEPTLDNLIEFAKQNTNPKLFLYQAHKLYEETHIEHINDIKKAIDTFLKQNDGAEWNELNDMYNADKTITLLGTDNMEVLLNDQKKKLIGSEINLKLLYSFNKFNKNYYWHILFLWAAHQDEANYKKSPQ